jgi:integrase
MTMPKKNQIQYLVVRVLAGGTKAYDWRPSPKWRRLGHVNTPLGTNKAEAFAAAIRLNEALGAGNVHAPSRAPAPPANLTFAQLVQAYFASDEFAYNDDGKRKSPETQKQYRWALNTLDRWATLPNGHSVSARLIDADMVDDLKRSMQSGSSSTRASLLRSLKILMGWATRRKHIPLNPCADLSIPEAEKRTKRILESTVIWLGAWLEPRAPELALAISLAFYSTQREADLLQLTRFNWRALDDMASDDRRHLVGSDGRVMGISLIQNKTGEPIAVPLTPIRAVVEREMARRAALGLTDTHLIGYPRHGDEAQMDKGCTNWKLNRVFRYWLAEAMKAARAEGNNSLVTELHGFTFRDLRRSGMCWLRDLGCTVPMIAAISGHSIAYTTKILDTYMPKDSRIAAAGMAHAMARRAEINARDIAEGGQV